MSLHKDLMKANLDDNTNVSLSYSVGDDVVHAWDGFEEQVMNDSGLLQSVAELITEPLFKNDIIDSSR